MARLSTISVTTYLESWGVARLPFCKKDPMKVFVIKQTYPNGKTEKIRLKARTWDDAVKYVNGINSQTSMRAEILKERKVVYKYV